MSWDGKGFSKPLIMLDFKTPLEAVKKNAYRPDEDVEALLDKDMTSEQFIAALRSNGMIKEACDFMCFCVNRRIGVWWAFNCVEAVNSEIEEQLKKSPLSFEEQQQNEVEAKVAQWSDRSGLDAIKAKHDAQAQASIKTMEKLAGPEITNPKDPLARPQALLRQQLDNDFASLDNVMNEMSAAISALPQQDRLAAQSLVEKIYAKYETENGIHPMKALEQGIMKAIVPEPVPQDTALRDQYFAAINHKIEAVKEYIDQTINKHFPLKMPGLPKMPSKKKIDDALFAVKRWILTPTDENGKLALEAGKPVVKEPEGICALAAYWSSTNLTPEAKQPLYSPPGLAANGFLNTLFLCAMKKGGSKDYDQRYEEYFDLGIDVLTGVKTWDKEWEKEKVRIRKAEEEVLRPPKYGFGREK
ncbi:hypothetical protein P0136_07505 [Lentisphaerota bacterium ZTH]|nr:hypothetical protein JYG24_01380 [Lentisphaerota bacterium]WET05215.1 hypothetical protein P0136_07505 [Lentisphaerota bacterium ZTH]